MLEANSMKTRARFEEKNYYVIIVFITLLFSQGDNHSREGQGIKSLIKHYCCDIKQGGDSRLLYQNEIIHI